MQLKNDINCFMQGKEISMQGAVAVIQLELISKWLIQCTNSWGFRLSSLWMIWIRINGPRSLGLWYTKELTNPFPKCIYLFVWCPIIQDSVILMWNMPKEYTLMDKGLKIRVYSWCWKPLMKRRIGGQDETIVWHVNRNLRKWYYDKSHLSNLTHFT